MERREPPLVVNLSDVAAKRRLMQKIGVMSGLHDVSIRPRRKTRSLNANNYYFSAVVTPFREWLREQWGDPSITTEQAHIELKRAVLGVKERIREDTGEVMELIPTTHDMDKYDFANYIDKAAAWLADFAGIVVIPSEMFFDSK